MLEIQIFIEQTTYFIYTSKSIFHDKFLVGLCRLAAGLEYKFKLQFTNHGPQDESVEDSDQQEAGLRRCRHGVQEM